MREFDPKLFWRDFDRLCRQADFTSAATLLEDNCDSLFSFGLAERDLFDHCASMIPLRLQSFYPRIMLGLAWLRIAQWRFAQVDDLLSAIRLRIEEMERAGGEKEEASRLRHVLRHREMILAITQDDLLRGEELCRDLIEDRNRTDLYANGSLFSFLLLARREQFKLSDVDLLDGQARDYHLSSGSKNALVAHDTLAALSFFALGRTGEASQRLSNALDVARSLDKDSGTLSAVSALPLAEVLFESGSFAEAEELVVEHFPHCHELGILDSVIAGYLTRARLHCRAGEHAQAVDLLEDAYNFAARRGFRRLSACVKTERLRILVRQGWLGRDRDQVNALAGSDIENFMPGKTITTIDDAEAQARALVAEAHCNVAEGLRLGQAWSRRMQREGAVRSRVIWQIVSARFLLLAGEKRKATRLLHETLALASKGTFYASFLSEPRIMDSLRDTSAHLQDNWDPEVKAFCAKLLTLATSGDQHLDPRAIEEDGPASFDPLSSREIDVLILASWAWGNQEIANRLGLTEGTVKWYFQQIFDKLGVRKRALAVDKARRFGIISGVPAGSRRPGARPCQAVGT